jgi:hypothetical protein
VEGSLDSRFLIQLAPTWGWNPCLFLEEKHRKYPYGNVNLLEDRKNF